MTTEIREVHRYLQDPERTLAVLYRDGGLAQTVTPYEAMRLTSEGLAVGLVKEVRNREPYLSHLIATASIRAIRRCLSLRPGRIAAIAEDCYTVKRERCFGTLLFSHIDARSRAYAPASR